MELNKGNIKKIIAIVFLAILFSWALNNFSVVAEAFHWLVAIITPFVIGIALAFLINVLMRSLEKLWNKIFHKRRGNLKDKLRRPLCLLLSIVIITGLLFVLLFMLIPQLKNTGTAIWQSVPDFLANVDTWWTELAALLAPYGFVLPPLDLDAQALISSVMDFLTKVGDEFLYKTVDVTSTVFSGIFNTVVGLVFAIYILAQKEKLGKQAKKTLRAYLPAEKVEKVLDLCDVTNRTFTNFVTGQLTEAVIIGVLCFIGMLIFRIPYAAMVSVLVGFTALIPVFGAFIGTAIGALFILMVEPIKALWFVIFIIILQQLEGNLIYPKVVGSSVGLPGIWVLLAVTVGGSAFGFLGMLLSVPVCAVLYCLIKRSVNNRLAEKKIDENGNLTQQ